MAKLFTRKCKIAFFWGGSLTISILFATFFWLLLLMGQDPSELHDSASRSDANQQYLNHQKKPGRGKLTFYPEGASIPSSSARTDAANLTVSIGSSRAYLRPRMETIFKQYENVHGSRKCGKHIHDSSVNGTCNPRDNFGTNSSYFCFFLRLEKVQGWIPSGFEKAFLRNYTKKYIPVTCTITVGKSRDRVKDYPVRIEPALGFPLLKQYSEECPPLVTGIIDDFKILNGDYDYSQLKCRVWDFSTFETEQVIVNLNFVRESRHASLPEGFVIPTVSTSTEFELENDQRVPESSAATETAVTAQSDYNRSVVSTTTTTVNENGYYDYDHEGQHKNSLVNELATTEQTKSSTTLDSSEPTTSAVGNDYGGVGSTTTATTEEEKHSVVVMESASVSTTVFDHTTSMESTTVATTEQTFTTTTEQLSTTDEQPSITIKQSSTTVEQHSSIEERSSTTEVQTSTTPEDPSTTTEQLSTTEQTFTTTTEQLSTTDEQPSITTEQSSTTVEQHSSFEERSSTTEVQAPTTPEDALRQYLNQQMNAGRGKLTFYPEGASIPSSSARTDAANLTVSFGSSSAYLRSRMETIFKQYEIANGSSKCGKHIHVSSINGACNPRDNFGTNRGYFCFFLRLEKVQGWTPSGFEKAFFRNYTKDYIPVTCTVTVGKSGDRVKDYPVRIEPTLGFPFLKQYSEECPPVVAGIIDDFKILNGDYDYRQLKCRVWDFSTFETEQVIVNLNFVHESRHGFLSDGFVTATVSTSTDSELENDHGVPESSAATETTVTAQSDYNRSVVSATTTTVNENGYHDYDYEGPQKKTVVNELATIEQTKSSTTPDSSEPRTSAVDDDYGSEDSTTIATTEEEKHSVVVIESASVSTTVFDHTTEQSSTTVEQHSSIEERSSTTEVQTSTTPEDPSTTTKQLSTTTEQPSTTMEEEPTTVPQDVTTAYLTTDPTTPEQGPETTVALETTTKSATTTTTAATTVKGPTTVKEFAVDHDSSSYHVDDAVKEGEPSLLDPDPSSTTADTTTTSTQTTTVDDYYDIEMPDGHK